MSRDWVWWRSGTGCDHHHRTGLRTPLQELPRTARRAADRSKPVRPAFKNAWFFCMIGWLSSFSFVCSSRFGRTQNKATIRQPCMYGWSGCLERSTTGNSFGTYIMNVQKQAQDISVLSFILHWLTVSGVWAANCVWRPCIDSSHVTAPYKLSFYYYYYCYH